MSRVMCSAQSFEDVMVRRAQHFTRLGRQMAIDQLIAAEDHARMMMKQASPALQGIGKHLLRFVERILSE